MFEEEGDFIIDFYCGREFEILSRGGDGSTNCVDVVFIISLGFTITFTAIMKLHLQNFNNRLRSFVKYWPRKEGLSKLKLFSTF